MPNETRTRLLDTAERLFAHQGIAATSLRSLTREAGVNLAAVHYHFGSKEALLDAVVERRARPFNGARLSALDAAEARGSAGVDAVVRAFLSPALAHAAAPDPESQALPRLLARLQAQPAALLQPLLERHFGETNARFCAALERALPELPARCVAHRFRFLIGAANHLFSGNFLLDPLPEANTATHDAGDPAMIRERIETLIGFTSAGLQAPPPREHATQVPSSWPGAAGASAR